MASSKGKKSKNAMLNELQQMADRQTGFDYTSLIPSALTGQDRLIVEVGGMCGMIGRTMNCRNS